MEIDYEQGLKRLRELLSDNNPSAFDEFHLLQMRLLENLAEQRLYGRDDTNSSQRARIIASLNSFLANRLHLSISMIDLCTYDNQSARIVDEPHDVLAPSIPQCRLISWRAGDKVSVQGQDYWIDDPVQVQWLHQEDALYLQAPGRHAQSGQKVWLKQCQVSRPYETALACKRDLEKEERLLLKLQQEGQRDFPHLLGSESTTQSATLVHERLAGQSLAASFGVLSKPLDDHTTKRLLAGRKTLVQMLHVLHTKMNCSHRMLTPETLLLRPGTNSIILSDVGLAARTVQPGEGPQFYQAPEQRLGLPVPDRSTDIYQLGTLFYHLLTGQHITDTATNQESSLAPELAMVLRKAASPNPRDRWPNVYAFSQALRQLGY